MYKLGRNFEDGQTSAAEEAKIVPLLTPTSQHVPQILTYNLILYLNNQQPHHVEVVRIDNIN